MEIFCFFSGVLYLYSFSLYLPLFTLLAFYITPNWIIPFFFILGMALGWAHQWLYQPQGMPGDPVIPQAIVQGTIASIPLQSKQKTQFVLELEQYNNHPAQGLVQLAWYNHAPPLHAGQRWQLNAKLKKPRNFANPGSYDYVNALLKRHIGWTGYIRAKGNRRLADKPHWLNWLMWREYLGSALSQLSPDQTSAGVIQALALNLTHQISQEHWELFRRTGTTHLFGISGEHIALIAGLVYGLIKWLWTRSTRCCLRIPAPHIASIGAFLAALIYAFMAGFEPPVQRALIGCFFYTLYTLGKQRFTPWQIWRYALMGVVCIEPHAVLMQGFYFSFLAVACLLLTQQRWRFKGFLGKISLQLSCLIGLMPLTLYWYAYGSLNGLLANLFAIPLTGFLIVPLTLFTMSVCHFSWAWLPMKLLSWLISLLFQGLVITEHLAFINITWPIHSIEIVIACMGALLMWILLPTKPFKLLTLLWLLIPLFPPTVKIKAGEALIDVLDVGQGLAVVIRTQNHVLIYDTGDQFYQGSDFGKMVVLPYLDALDIKKIDAIVISHPDKDHRGGLHSIQAQLPVNQLLVNDPDYYHHALNCHDYPQWQWDKVQFRFLPIKIAFQDKNNSSCVLQVSTARGKVLLSGDIEKAAEDYLIRTYGEKLASDILIVPHHGSKTSSSYRFLLDVSPQYAIASLGFDNRFHFPHAKTLASMAALNIPFYRTDECGMVEIKLPAHAALSAPECFSGKNIS